MFLFSEEKSKILKIVNAILLLWLIGSLIFVINSLVQTIFFKTKNNEITLSEYTRNYCYIHEENPTIQLCEKHWVDEKEELEKENDYFYYNPIEETIYSGVSFIVVAGTIIIINFPKKRKTS